MPANPRLQKVLAVAGLGSRRKCEELIKAGRVEIDGVPVDRLGIRVDPVLQEIRVDGQVIRTRRAVCYLVNKPLGVVATNRDQAGRTRVIDLVPGGETLFTVGRLDKSSEGLILVTNDGELANRLTHPRYGVEKTYRVLVAGQVSVESLRRLQQGVHLAEGVARVARVRIKSRSKRTSVLQMVLREGRNREIRRVLARIGHKVLSLRRVALGPLRLEGLAPGGYRQLSQAEIRQLYRMSSGAAQS
jgi:23S rRNA pseudouridine2605 synthase